MRKIIIGVMGPGNGASEKECGEAYELGRLIAREGWTVLSGGLAVGVMDAVSRGASEAGGLTIGILPMDDRDGMSPAVDIPIVTGMGSARNNINALSSDVVIACGISPGTASEVALAIKADKPVIFLSDDEDCKKFFQNLGGKKIRWAKDPEQAIGIAKKNLARTHGRWF